MADSSAGSGNGGWMAAAMQGLITGASAVSKGGPKRQYKYNKKLAEDQNKMNRENTEWILQQNKQMLDEQRGYDSPAEMMKRYKAAGLNPNLIYDKGANSSAPIQVGGMPGVNMGQVDASYPDVGMGFLQAGQGIANIANTQTRTENTAVDTQAKSLQTEIARTNPMLKPYVSEWVADSMKEAAKVKAMESRFLLSGEQSNNSNYARKIAADIQAMEQKLGLNTKDIAIKNKILESKEYENAVKEVQAKWMKDSEVTPEHIRQGLMLLLSKMIN